MTKEANECWSLSLEGGFIHDSLFDLLHNERDDLEAGAIVYFGEIVTPNARDLFDVDAILEMIGERAYDMAGEYARTCACVSVEAKKELDDLVSFWIKKHCMLNFYTVTNIREYVITKEDLEMFKEVWG